MADSDDNGVVGIEVLGIELMLVRFDFRATLVAILLLHLNEVFLHNLLAQFGVVEDSLQMSDKFLKFLILIAQLVHTQTCELSQTHIYNGF